MTIKALLSRGDGTDVDVDLEKWKPKGERPDELLWVDVDRPTRADVESLSRTLKLDGHLIEAFESTSTTPDATVHEGTIEVTILALPGDLDDQPVPVRILIGPGWVVTHRADDVPFVDDFRERITDQRQVGRLTPLEFLASLLDVAQNGDLADARLPHLHALRPRPGRPRPGGPGRRPPRPGPARGGRTPPPGW